MHSPILIAEQLGKWRLSVAVCSEGQVGPPVISQWAFPPADVTLRSKIGSFLLETACVLQGGAWAPHPQTEEVRRDGSYPSLV